MERSKNLFVCLFILGLVFPSFVASQNYRPDETLRNDLRKVTWSMFKPATPKKYRFLTSMVFNSNKCFDLYEKATKEHGFPTYNPITVLTFREVILNETLRGSDYSETEVKEAYQKIKKGYMAHQSKSLSNSQLQEKHDPIILEALWIATLNEFSKGRDEEVKKLALKRLGHEDERELVAEIKQEKTSAKPASLPRSADSRAKAANGNAPQISDIILRTVTNYGLNGVYIDNEVSVLFANGEILTNPVDALDELNTQRSKSKYPKRWNTWEKKNDIIYVTKAWKGKTYDWKKWFKVRPAKNNQRLSGKFNTSDPFGGDRVINASTVSFDSSGRFVWKTIKGGDTSWKPMYSRTNEAGTYIIKDFKITLNYNNGRTESFFFGFYPKDYEHFVVGSSHFVPVE